MSDVVYQALIAALLAVYMEWSRRKVAIKIEEVHKATNSLTDRLVETTRTEAHAAGLKEGTDRK